jgi:SCY1-like protein 2
LIKGYSIQGDALCSTGIVRSWKLYKAHNSSNQKEASIFLIEKRQLKKVDREETMRMSKKESTNLVRVRHPGVLAVIEPLTEDENVLAFVS